MSNWLTRMSILVLCWDWRLAINSLQPVRCYALHGGYLLAVSAYLASQDLVADYDASSRVNSVWFSSETCRHELDTDVRLLLSSADDVMMPVRNEELEKLCGR